MRNGPTIVPLELLAGLQDGATSAMADNIADDYARCDMRHHGAALQAAQRVPPPRATLERIAKRIPAGMLKDAPRVEAVIRGAEKVQSSVRGVVMGLDRTSAPMSEPRPPEVSPAPRQARTTPRVRAVPPPIEVNYRMAYVGTVSLVDEHGKAVVTRRHATPACDDPNEMAARTANDVEAALATAPTLSIGCVQDGAPEMWKVTRGALAALEERGVLARWEGGVDRYHVLDRLGKALVVIELPRRSAPLD